MNETGVDNNIPLISIIIYDVSPQFLIPALLLTNQLLMNISVKGDKVLDNLRVPFRSFIITNYHLLSILIILLIS
jgi:hypothetical protein